jgi:hypothetical protein
MTDQDNQPPPWEAFAKIVTNAMVEYRGKLGPIDVMCILCDLAGGIAKCAPEKLQGMVLQQAIERLSEAAGYLSVVTDEDPRTPTNGNEETVQ